MKKRLGYNNEEMNSFRDNPRNEAVLDAAPQIQNKTIVIEVLDSHGCNSQHKIGDKFRYPEDKGKICTAALHAIYPYALGIQIGGSFPWEEEANSITICCPDYKNPVVFKITREE